MNDKFLKSFTKYSSNVKLCSYIIFFYLFLFYSTIVEAEWTYDNMKSADFDNAWLTVKDAILEKFAGPPDTGVYSPSVQHTLYQAEKTVLEKVSEVSSIFLSQMIKNILGMYVPTIFYTNGTKIFKNS